ncbi:MAG: HD domain-containing protein [Microlunatus sp.]|nr:HD domain-containing protein [Microlunatus sp.]
MTSTTRQKILYVDMDNTLVDFRSGLDRIDPETRATYLGREDEIPGIFAAMSPMPGAVEAFAELSTLFDAYILSTAPWLNPSAWRDKLEWVQRHFGAEVGSLAYKRLILSHHKDLSRGDFLVDDRPAHRGAAEFEGEVLPFGPAHNEFPDWASILAYLRPYGAEQDHDQAAFGIDDARNLATRAHAGQRDKQGRRYIEHVRAVADGLRDFDLDIQIAGMLHDVIEDTGLTLDDLRSSGVSERALAAIELVSRNLHGDLSYDQGIELITTSPDATLVKIADNAHNSRPDRVAELSRLTGEPPATKYGRAREILYPKASVADIRRILCRVAPELLDDLLER